MTDLAIIISTFVPPDQNFTLFDSAPLSIELIAQNPFMVISGGLAWQPPCIAVNRVDDDLIWAEYLKAFQSQWEDPEEPIQYWKIEPSDLPPGEPYQVIAPIPVVVMKDNETEFTAEIHSANLAATGNTRKEAFNYLVCVVLEAFDYLAAHESELGIGPTRQFAFLRAHLGKTDNGSR